MKVTEVRAIPLAIPLAKSTPASPWAAGLARQILVRVTTDAGLVGWGECFAYGATLAVCDVVDSALVPLVVGQSRARVYASLLRFETPTQVAQAVSAALVLGYTAVKLHQVDVDSVAAAREAAGADVDIMLDTNCPWTVEEAIRLGRRLERYELRWLEEPVWPPEDYAGLARVRQAVRIPIACGENEATVFAFRDIVRAGAADIVQPSITKVGGLLEMKKIATVAAAANVTFVPHSFYFGPGLAATIHVVASTPGVPYMEMPPGHLVTPLMAEPIRCNGGVVTVPEGPGLGADPDPDVLTRYPFGREGAKPFILT